MLFPEDVFFDADLRVDAFCSVFAFVPFFVFRFTECAGIPYNRIVSAKRIICFLMCEGII